MATTSWAYHDGQRTPKDQGWFVGYLVALLGVASVGFTAWQSGYAHDYRLAHIHCTCNLMHCVNHAQFLDCFEHAQCVLHCLRDKHSRFEPAQCPSASHAQCAALSRAQNTERVWAVLACSGIVPAGRCLYRSLTFTEPLRLHNVWARTTSPRIPSIFLSVLLRHPQACDCAFA